MAEIMRQMTITNTKIAAATIPAITPPDRIGLVGILFIFTDIYNYWTINQIKTCRYVRIYYIHIF